MAYSPEERGIICAEVCKIISTTKKSLKNICKSDNMPDVSTILYWLNDEKDKTFSIQYARAKQAQADIFVDEIIEIADDDSGDLDRVDDYGNRIENKEFTNRSKIRIDARKWAASKLAPKKYGEKLDVDVHGSVSHSIERHVVVFQNYKKQKEVGDGDSVL